MANRPWVGQLIVGHEAIPRVRVSTKAVFPLMLFQAVLPASHRSARRIGCPAQGTDRL